MINMNNKGFTLVELLAVILILLGISLIAVSSVSSSLGRREDKEITEQQELAKNAAKIYFSLSDTEVTQVTVLELKNGQYFNGESKTSKLNDNDYVKIEDNTYKYCVAATNECK